MLFLFSVLASAWASSSGYSSDIFPKVKYEIEPKVLNSSEWNGGDYTWYDFFFGEAGTLAYNYYLINASTSFYVAIQDCFCEGDVFQLNNFDIYQFITDQNCNYPNQDTAQCNYFSDQFSQCLTDGYHCGSSGNTYSAGFHNMTIFVLQSPLKFGRAYIGFKIAPSK